MLLKLSRLPIHNIPRNNFKVIKKSGINNPLSSPTLQVVPNTYLCFNRRYFSNEIKTNTTVPDIPPSISDEGTFISRTLEKFINFTNELAPIDWSAQILSNLHEWSHLPWWAFIPLVASAFRLTTIPLSLSSSKMQQKLFLIPDFQVLTTMMNSAEDNVQKKRIKVRINQLMKENGISNWKALIPIVIQVPIGFLLIFGFNRLALTDLTMISEGALWFKNLSESDPFWRLPLIYGGIATGSYLASYSSTKATGPLSTMLYLFQLFCVRLISEISQASALYITSGAAINFFVLIYRLWNPTKIEAFNLTLYDIFVDPKTLKVRFTPKKGADVPLGQKKNKDKPKFSIFDLQSWKSTNNSINSKTTNDSKNLNK